MDQETVIRLVCLGCGVVLLIPLLMLRTVTKEASTAADGGEVITTKKVPALIQFIGGVAALGLLSVGAFGVESAAAGIGVAVTIVVIMIFMAFTS